MLPAPVVPTISHPLDTSNFDVPDDEDDDSDDDEREDPNASHWEGLWLWVDDVPETDRLQLY